MNKIVYKVVAITGMAVVSLLCTTQAFSQDLSTALKLTQSERYEDADSVFKILLKQSSSDADVNFYYGENVLKTYMADQFSNVLADMAKIATDLFKEGIQKDSNNVLNYIGMGMVTLLEKGDTLLADKYFKRVERSFPKKVKKYDEKNVRSLILLATAQLYDKTPRYAKAIAYLETAKEAAPNNTEVYNALGDIYIDKGDASEAIKNYNKVVFLNPKLAAPIVKIGNLYMRSRNLQEARVNFERAIEIDSSYAPAYKGLGEMYSLAGKNNFATLNFKKFFSLTGNNIPAKKQLVNSLFRAKAYKEVLTYVDEILAFDKNSNYLNRIAAYSCYELKQNDYYTRGLKYIETFFSNTTPDKVIYKDYKYYGLILLKAKKDSASVESAFEKLVTANQMEPNDIELVSDIAFNAYFNKKYALAADMMNKKIAFGKTDKNDYMLLGKAYYQLGSYDKADTALNTVISMDADFMQAYVWLASTYVAMDPESKEGKALPKYEMVIQKGLTDTVKYAKELFDAYSYIASFYLFTKTDYTNAEIYYQKILNLDPKNCVWQVKGYSALGLIYQRKKDFYKSRSYYQKVLVCDPKNDGTLRIIETLTATINKMEVERQLQ